MKADLVLKNGYIYSVNKEESIFEAIAMKDKKIVWTGSNAEVEAFVGEQTKVIDLEGKFAMPAAFDSHAHMTSGGIASTQEIDLTTAASKEEILSRIREYIAEHPEKEFYIGTGFCRPYFDELGPTKEMLDEICNDKPIWVSDLNAHCCWVNSKALENAGITKDTPNPPGGIFQRYGKDGDVTGFIIECPAVDYAKRNIPPYSKEQWKEAILEAQKLYHKQGFTATYEAGMYLDVPEVMDAYNELAEEGLLKLRVRAAWWINETMTEEEMDAYLDRIEKWAKDFKTDYFQFNSIKILMDGCIEDKSAYMLEPYLNAETPGYMGESSISKESFQMMLEKIEERKMQVHIHQIGDRVAEEALEKFEELQEKYGDRDRRNTFAHCQCLSTDQIKRMGALKMCAATSSNWAVISPETTYGVYIPAIGVEKTSHMYRIHSLMREGVNISYHSDYYVSVPTIPYELYSALTRSYPKSQFDAWYDGTEIILSDKRIFPAKENESVPLPPYDEVISLPEALKMLTYNGAYTHFMEKEYGSIEAGKWADIVVLDGNPFTYVASDIEKIGELKPCMTIFDGEVVYEGE